MGEAEVVRLLRFFRKYCTFLIDVKRRKNLNKGILCYLTASISKP